MNRGDAIGRYRLDSPLGGGGMGVVHLAEDQTLEISEHDGQPFIAMEWLEGHSLHASP
jgi:serine/threonine protein kinase